VAGIEPASSAWKADALPLSYTRSTGSGLADDSGGAGRSDVRGERRCARQRDLAVLCGRPAADADRADDLLGDQQRDAALQGNDAGETRRVVAPPATRSANTLVGRRNEIALRALAIATSALPIWVPSMR
jgi:hypothetical protein